MKIGLIYKLSFKNSRYFLYGSSINFVGRKAQYKYDLSKGKYKNTHLQRVYNKYGKENMVFEIVQDNIPEDILRIVENIWIGANCAKSYDHKGGMNIADAEKRIVSEQTRKKMSLNMKIIMKNDPERAKLMNKNSVKTRTKPIIAIYKSGKVEKYNSTKQILDMLKISYSSIVNGVRNKNSTCRNEIKFMYEDEYDNNIDHSYLFVHSRSIPVIQYDLQGNFIKEWKSSKDAGLKLNINNTTISMCCMNKKYKSAGGFIWKYKNKEKYGNKKKL